VVKSPGYYRGGPVVLVHTQNLRFFYKEKPTCGFGECPLWMEDRTLSIRGSRSAFDPISDMSAARGYFTRPPKMHSPEMKVLYGILPL
jgi:hypothetical protein